MNVGIVTAWFERGAAYVSRQYRDLLARDHHVFIYARGGGIHLPGADRWRGEGVAVAARPRHGVATWVDRRDFTRWLQVCGIDVVFFNEQTFWSPLRWCAEAGIKTGAYVDYYTESTIPLFAAYDFLICNTRRHFSAFSWHPQAYYVPWGTQVDCFQPQARPASDELVFFHSAGLSPGRKGTDLAIQAFRNVRGPARLVIHSQANLAEALPALADTIFALEQEGRLEVIEKTVSAPGLYHLGDVYVYPSRLDGIGLTVAEALACGLPVIVPDQPPMNEFVDAEWGNGRTARVSRQYARSDGYYWPQCEVDLDSLTEQMQRYVDERRDLPRLRKEARDYALAHLDWTARRQDVERVFTESRILDTPAKAEGLRMAVGHDLSQLGGTLPLWNRFPRMLRASSGTLRALRSLGLPVRRLVKWMVR